MLCKVDLPCTCNSVMKSSSDLSNESYTEQYFPVVLFIMLYKLLLTFESVGEIRKRDHSNESY